MTTKRITVSSTPVEITSNIAPAGGGLVVMNQGHVPIFARSGTDTAPVPATEEHFFAIPRMFPDGPFGAGSEIGYFTVGDDTESVWLWTGGEVNDRVILETTLAEALAPGA